MINDILPGLDIPATTKPQIHPENIDLIAALTNPDVAKVICTRYAYLREIQTAPIEELLRIPGMGPAMARRLQAALELAARLTRETMGERPMLDTPDKVADLLREDARPYLTETLTVVLLDTRRRLKKIVKLATGTLDTLLIHPREVFSAAVAAGAHAIILSHSHPSGCADPSESDIRVTRDLIRAGQLLKIEVLDHVILGQRTTDRPKDFVSLREMGYFYE
jgi:DNA repair protein RadC